MNKEKAIQRFEYYFEAAITSDCVNNPVAWTLCKTCESVKRN